MSDLYQKTTYFAKRQRRLGNLFLEKFLFAVSASKLIVEEPVKFSQAVSLVNSKINVHREFDNMDIVIDFPEKRFVLAIENKINHIEDEGQIARYQNKLPERYENYDKYSIIFLTPDGKDPITCDLNHSLTSVYSLSYGSLLEIVDEAAESALGDVKAFLNQFLLHLKEDIVGNSEAKKLCHEIYKKHPDAYRYMIKNLPSLNELEKSYYGLISKQYPDVNLSRYPARGDNITELSVKNVNWKLDTAEIKLFIDWENYSLKIFAAVTKSIAQKYSSSLFEEFNIKPSEVNLEWCWWSFTDYGIYEIENDDVFGEKTAKRAFDEFEKIYKGINKKLLNLTN